MTNKFKTLAATLLLSLSAHASDTSNRLIIQPLEGLSQQSLVSFTKPHGNLQKLGQSNIYVLTVNGNSSKKAFDTLKGNKHLKSVSLDQKLAPIVVPNDPYFGSSYHVSIIGAPTAWETTLGNGITIAVLDSGVDNTHPDLVNNLTQGYNFINSNTDANDVCGHGTKVAGVSAAAINNGIGVSGVAGAAKIMPLRVAGFDTTCSAYASVIARGVVYAADNGARIANVSFGGVVTDAGIINAGNYMKGKGGLLFVSSGNTGADLFAAPTDAFVVVGSTNSQDIRSYFSSYGSAVSLAAPGEGIYTTSMGGGYGAVSGTSFASPLAAGVGALVMSANPALSGEQVKSILQNTAVDLGEPGRDIYYGFGRVDAAAAVASAVSFIPVIDTQAPSVFISNPAANSSVSGLVVVDVSATDNVGVVSVSLSANGSPIATDVAAPYSFSWDSTNSLNGSVSLAATAKDAAGNSKTSAVLVTVANAVAPPINDTSPPVVVITNPVSGNVSGKVNIKVEASDNQPASGLTQKLYIDGVLKSSGTGGALSFLWNTSPVVKGVHTIKAVVNDASGNVSEYSVSVRVVK